MNYNLIKQIVEYIKEYADEIIQKDEKDDFDNGQIIAYAEVLSVIQDVYSDYDLSKIGLDFDIDTKYL